MRFTRVVYALAIYMVVCFMFSVLVHAQSYTVSTPRVEVFGGYSLLHDSNAFPTNFHGWDASSTTYVNRWLGITADFSGHYSTTDTSTVIAPGVPADARTTQRIHNFMFGPHFAYRKSRYVPFGQALFGFNHTAGDFALTCSSCSAPGFAFASTNTFSMALGGGIDFAVGHGFYVRPVQAEYILRRVGSFNDNQFRYSAGLVFRMGSVGTTGR